MTSLRTPVWLLLLAVSYLPFHHTPTVLAQEFPKLELSQDWPWWRGPNRDGHAPSTSQVPTRFSDTENVLWRVPVPGRGHSSPIAVGGRVFLATADEPAQIHSVLAYDLESGRQLWKQDLSQGGFPDKNHPKNTEASTTVASDGERLYVTFFHHAQIELICLDFEGGVVWRQNIGKFRPQRFEYGYAASPVLYKKSVIAIGDYDGESWLAAFDRRSGRELWRTPRPNMITFSSPVIANVAGKDQLLVSGARNIASYNPDSGELAWTTPGCAAATCGTMIWAGDTVFASGGYPEAETLAVKADGSQQKVWKNNQKCYEQSMIVVAGFVYGLTDRGILYCWRAKDGQEMWRERLTGPVSASPIYVGGYIYWANEGGTVYVFRPSGDKFDLVSENRVGNVSFASPAVAGNRLLLRVAEKDRSKRQEFLVCIGAE